MFRGIVFVLAYIGAHTVEEYGIEGEIEKIY